VTADENADALNFVRRKMIWDLLPPDDTDCIFNDFGLTPASEDVAALEHQESLVRQRFLGTLAPAVDVYASMASEIIGATMMHNVDISPEDRHSIHTQNFGVVRPAVYAVIGQLLETGLLKMGDNKVVAVNG
jgi:hypothetical protein